jgi:hypothetical protein
MNKEFEYKVIYDIDREYPGIGFPDLLNKLGLEGWELASVCHNGNTNSLTGLATFKREKTKQIESLLG